jgi:hypothetical protein
LILYNLRVNVLTAVIILKMEAARSSETSVNTYRTATFHIPNDGNLQEKYCFHLAEANFYERERFPFTCTPRREARPLVIDRLTQILGLNYL